ncbi:hypothetical protein OHC33_003269 [Knufia fluminis]|uniref:ERCC4 domain-containing protein n=1 Tax=Knufia fluminis TaxID=191047 RepID=A0AAN8ENZ7_9EURO|nr:hypothetical protein OHC33_003269 [Knufia fluminis]
MHEVIELLSSSPPACAPARSRPGTAPQPVQRQTYNVQDETIHPRLPDIDLFDGAAIDAMLMSSPRDRKPTARLPQQSSPADALHAAPAANLRGSARFDDSILDGLDEPGFPIEQPAKKRKLTPPTVKGAAIDVLASVNEIFDLSSEPDIVPRLPNQRLSTGTNVTVHDLDDDDDGLGLPSFSSSAPEPRHNAVTATIPRSKDPVVEILSDDDAVANDPIMSSSQPVKPARAPGWSNRTSSVLANIKQTNSRASTHSRESSLTNSTMLKQSKPRQMTKAKIDELDNIVDSSQPGAVSVSPEKRSNATKKAKAPAKPRKTAAEKEAEQEEKRLAKERQAAEKQLAADKAEVNKRKTDRKKSAEEMLVCMPTVFKGKAIGNQVEGYMKEINVQVSFYDDEVDMTRNDGEVKSLGKVIKWKRKVTATYDEGTEEWVPLGRTKIQPEKHILVYLTGEEFCTIAAAGPHGDISGTTSPPTEETMKENLSTYIVLLNSQHPACTIILLIEGLSSFTKRIANTKNREFQASVRAQNINPEDATSTSSAPASSIQAPKKRKQTKPQIDLTFFTNDITEILQLHLQLSHQGLQIHHTTSLATSAKQIDSFTQHLSTRPYRQTELSRNLSHASFCMASGQFRTGQGDATETFIKMLEQVNRLTVSMAHGIISAGYDSPAALVRGFKRAEESVTGGARSLGGETGLEREGREKAKLMLEDVRKAANKGGAWNNQRLGPQISKRLWKVFTSGDEDMRDGIA